MSDSSSNRGPFISLPMLVFGVFLVLKLAEIGVVATWSWWWVTAPLWIPAGIALSILAVIMTFMITIALAGAIGLAIARRKAMKKAEKDK